MVIPLFRRKTFIRIFGITLVIITLVWFNVIRHSLSRDSKRSFHWTQSIVRKEDNSPVSNADNSTVSGSDNLAILNENNIPVSNEHESPVLNEVNLSISKTDSSSVLKADLLDILKRDTTSSSKGDNPPFSKGDNPPFSKGDNLSFSKGDNSPVTQEENLPILKGDDYATLKEDISSILKTDQLSRSKDDNLFVFKEHHLITLKEEDLLILKENNVLILKGDALRAPKGDNSSATKRNYDDLFLPPECILPLQWTLEKNSSNISEPWPVLHQEENDTCLELQIKKYCYRDGHIVPNVVHYMMFGRNQFRFYTLLSLLATWKYIKPYFIVIHGNLPFGDLFETFLMHKPRIILVTTIPKETVFGKKLCCIEHKTDVARLEIMIKYGGIYMDPDEIPLKSLDQLRDHSVVLGQEADFQLGKGVIVAEPSATFLKIWMATYRNYKPEQWAFHSAMVPFHLAKLLSNMVYITQIFFKPNYSQLDQLYKRNIDWSEFYGVHLYGKIYIEGEDLDTIRYLNNTFGSIARYVYFGNKTLQNKWAIS